MLAPIIIHNTNEKNSNSPSGISTGDNNTNHGHTNTPHSLSIINST